MQCKIFEALFHPENKKLENKINSWLQKNPHINIILVAQSGLTDRSGYSYNIVSIFYE